MFFLRIKTRDLGNSFTYSIEYIPIGIYIYLLSI